jgi:hypothetical protein
MASSIRGVGSFLHVVVGWTWVEAARVGGLDVCGSRGDLLSHRVAPAVPSALEGLTSGFGMCPGVSPPLRPREICVAAKCVYDPVFGVFVFRWVRNFIASASVYGKSSGY